MNSPPTQEKVSHAPHSAAATALAEIMERLQAGGAPDIEQLLAEHPDCADELRSILPTMVLLNDLAYQPLGACATAGLPSSAYAGAAAPPAAGVLGDFRIIRELGRGGMGIVYEAEQISLSRRVALKVLPFAAVLDPRHLQRFKNEALAAAHLAHPNIVDVYGVGCERSIHFYAMRLIEGQTLAAVIEGLKDEVRSTKDETKTPLRAPVEGRSGEGKEKGTDDDAASVGNALRGVPSRATAGCSELAVASLSSSPDHPLNPEPRTLNPSAADTSPIAALSTLRTDRPKDFYRLVAELGIQAAEALDHAHQMGIVHRDIKPSNLILECSYLAPRDGTTPRPLRGEVGRGVKSFLNPDRSLPAAAGTLNPPPTPKLWITDFGLARFQNEPGMTMTGDLVGTLRYMAPEQALAKRVTVDHRADIYSLGVTLYELVTLRQVFAGADHQTLLRQIANDEPVAPRRLNPAIPFDLETILLKAMAKDPRDRYATARDLAADLDRLAQQQPIQARRPGVLNRLARWALRHYAVALIVSFTLVLSLLMGATLIWREQRRTAAALKLAEEERRNVERTSAKLAFERAITLCERGESGAGLLWLAHSLDLGATRLPLWERVVRRNLSAWNDTFAVLDRIAGHTPPTKYPAIAVEDGGTIIIGGSNRILIMDCATGVQQEFPLPEGRLFSATLSQQAGLLGLCLKTPLPALLAPGEPAGPSPVHLEGHTRVFLLRRDTGQLREFQVERSPPDASPTLLAAIQLRPDGNSLAVASGDSPSGESIVRFYDVATGKESRQPIKHNGLIRRLRYWPDGDRLAVAGKDICQIWDMNTGTLIDEFRYESKSDDHNKFYGEPISISNDGKRLFTINGSGKARSWDLTTRQSIPFEVVHTQHFPSLSISPDGLTAVTGGADGTARVWDVQSGRCTVAPLYHRYGNRVTFVNDRQIATIDWQGDVRIWQLPQRMLPIIPQNGQRFTQYALNSNGSRIAIASADNSVRVYDLATRQIVSSPFVHPAPVLAIAYNNDGRSLVTGCEDTRARVWDIPSSTTRSEFKHALPVQFVAMSPDRTTVLSGDGAVGYLWDASTGKGRGSALWDGLQAAAFSPDGRFVITGNQVGTARIWESATGKLSSREMTVTKSSKTPGSGPPSSPNSLGSLAQRLSSIVNNVRFSPDGRTAMTATLDGSAQLWDCATGALRQTFRIPGPFNQIIFHPDGKIALAIARNGNARLLDLETGLAIGPGMTVGGDDSSMKFLQGTESSSVVFSNDGHLVAFQTTDGSIRFQRIPAPLTDDAAKIRLLVETTTGMRLDADDSIQTLDSQEWRQRAEQLRSVAEP